jgi:hypothetical protein
MKDILRIAALIGVALIGISLIISFNPGVSHSAPFLVSDYFLVSDSANMPDTFNIKYGTVTVTGPSIVQTNANGDKRLYWDLGTLSPGTYNLSVTSVKNDVLWGATESTPVPFVFTKPAPVGTLRGPVNINISR